MNSFDLREHQKYVHYLDGEIVITDIKSQNGGVRVRYLIVKTQRVSTEA